MLYTLIGIKKSQKIKNIYNFPCSNQEKKQVKIKNIHILICSVLGYIFLKKINFFNINL